MTIPVRSTLDFGGTATATGLPAPVAGSDAATKTYVDGKVLALTVDVAFGTTPVAAVTQTFTWTGVTTSHTIVASFGGETDTGLNRADELEMDSHSVGALSTLSNNVTVQIMSSHPTTQTRRVQLLAYL